jgi:hypothetical protein
VAAMVAGTRGEGVSFFYGNTPSGGVIHAMEG